MPRIMIPCPYDCYQEFFTGFDRPKNDGLKGLGNRVVQCPVCNGHHYLRRLYFEGEEAPGNKASERITSISALDVAYGIAGEIGVLIGEMALIETYLPM